MAQRVLLVEESRPVAAALRRHLEGAGFRVEQVGRDEALSRLGPAHALAVVRAEGRDAGLAAALKRADPALPVVLVVEDEEDPAAADPSADGVLVGPLTRAAVVTACRAAARLRAQALRIAELERGPAAPGPADLQMLKRVLLQEVKRSRRYHYPISLALVAVDRWKELAAGLDGRARAAFLGEILGVVSRAVRDVDLALAYSAERLLVLMPHTRSDGAMEAANRLVSRIRAHGGRARASASVGVATFDGEGAVSFASLTRGAAEALARAQVAGGDRAERSGGPRRKRDRVVIG